MIAISNSIRSNFWWKSCRHYQRVDPGPIDTSLSFFDLGMLEAWQALRPAARVSSRPNGHVPKADLPSPPHPPQSGLGRLGGLHASSMHWHFAHPNLARARILGPRPSGPWKGALR